MSEENASQEFRLKNIHEARNYFIEGINQNELMSRNKKVLHLRLLDMFQFLLLLL